MRIEHVNLGLQCGIQSAHHRSVRIGRGGGLDCPAAQQILAQQLPSAPKRNPGIVVKIRTL